MLPAGGGRGGQASEVIPEPYNRIEVPVSTDFDPVFALFSADVIKAVTNADLQYEESEDKVDMCQALRDIQMEGRMIQAVADAKIFYKAGVAVDKIAQGLGCDVETVKGWIICPDDSHDIEDIEQEIGEKAAAKRETQIIQNMRQKGLSLEQIADFVGKPVQEVQKAVQQ